MSGRLSQAERASLGLSAGGLIIDGVRVPVPGVRVTTWVDDPKRAPPITDGRAITKRPIAFVWHTSKGILCRTAAPAAIPAAPSIKTHCPVRLPGSSDIVIATVASDERRRASCTKPNVPPTRVSLKFKALRTNSSKMRRVLC